MNKGLGIFLLACCINLMGPKQADAQFFSRNPRNFDECVAQRMQGTTSDLAARAIYQACRNMFPEVDLNSRQNLTDITRNLVNFSISADFQGAQNSYYRVFHETPGFGIVSLNLRISDGSTTRNFECKTSDNTPIRPGVAGTVYCVFHLHGIDMRRAQTTYHTVLGRRI